MKNKQKPGEILFLTREDVYESVTAGECVDRCGETFRWVGEGLVEQIPPISFWVSEPEDEFGHGFIQSYPAHVRPLRAAGNKWLGGYAKNRLRSLPSLSALVLLSDTETAMPVAIMDGVAVTALRTAGHSGVGIRELARKNASIFSLIGCGVQGRAHLKILTDVWNFEEIRIYDMNHEAAEASVEEIGEESMQSSRIHVCSEPREAAEGADVICMATTSREPVVMASWISEGALVCGINGFLDLDPESALSCDKWILGYYERDLEWVDGAEVGKNSPPSFPYTRSDIHADLATEIIPGKKKGREHEKERIAFTHHGMPALDTALAHLVYEKACALDRGTVLSIL